MVGAPVYELVSKERLLGLLLDIMRLVLVASELFDHPLFLLAHQ